MRATSHTLFLIGAVTLLGMVLHRLYGAAPGAPQPSWPQSLFVSYSLLLVEHISPLPAHPVGQFVQYFQPFLGIFLLAEGLIKLGMTYFRKEANAEAWVEILARASRGHVILCGIGSVGFRVIEELVGLGEQVFAVERNPNCAFLDRARALGAHVLIGDARADHVQKALNIADASAVIIATNDDLANLEIAMDVREVRNDVPVVMRLFDQQLARKVKSALGVDVSVSTSQLAAPLFASAALDRSVVATHRVGESLMVVIELDIHPRGALVGLTAGDLLAKHQLSVLALRRGVSDWTLQPGPEVVVQAGDKVQVMVLSRALHEVHQMNAGAS